MMNTEIAVSTNATMSTRLINLDSQFEEAARREVQTYLERTGSAFTQTERYALVKFEKLKLIGNLTLLEVMLRGQTIQEIEAQGLWSAHPGQYGSMEEAANAQGISASEYSNVRDLYEIVFPYLTANGYNVAGLWESIGKSNFRELTPVLKRLITNEESRSSRVEQVFENEMNDVFATAAAAGENITEEAAREEVIDQLIVAGHLPVRELRQRIRPERTPSVEAYRLPYRNNRSIVMMVVDSDQEEMVNRRLTGYIDVTPVNRDDMNRAPIFRELGTYLRGEL